MYPYNKSALKTYVESEVNKLNLGDYDFNDVVKQILFIMHDINEYLFSKVNDSNLFHENKYIRDRAGNPTSNFVKLCSNEHWEHASAVADTVNKGFLKHSTIYQDYIRDIKKSPEYLSTFRNNKLKSVLED